MRERSRSCPALTTRHGKSHNLTCWGNDRVGKDKERFTKEEVTCSLQSCPKDYNWGTWGSWSTCSSSCGFGERNRWRSCDPPIEGGLECPEEVDKDGKPINDPTNNPLKDTQICHREVCESHKWTPWGPWSQITESCGTGVRVRERKCISEKSLQYADNRVCLPLHDNAKETHWIQKRKSKLQECPVDGGWTPYTSWGPCSQNCIPDPEEQGSQGDDATKAVQRRQKHCSNPIRRFGGKNCQNDKTGNETYKTEYISDQNVMEQERPCQSEEGKKPNYCPVNCVYSAWGEWTACSATCIQRGELIYHPKNTKQARNYPETIQILNGDVPTGSLPRRTRRMCKLKEAKHGGRCEQDQESVGNIFIKTDQDKQFIEQSQDCALVDVHCYSKEKNPQYQDQFKWPEVKYPGDNPGKVGYCPIPCKWEDWVREEDCCQKLEDYFNKTETKENCYQATFAEEVSSKEEAETLYKEITRIIADRDYRAGEPKFLKELEKKNCRRNRRSIKCKHAEKLLSDFMNDVKELYGLTLSAETRKVILPNIDGLYGGKGCEDKDGNKLTKYDKESDDVYQGSSDSHEFYCDINVCPVVFDDMPVEPVKQACIAVWTEWGSWGKCSKGCGDHGERTRSRDCKNPCTDEKADDKKCRPASRAGNPKEKVTNEDRGPCTPCPPDHTSHWGEWGQWTSNKPYGCSDKNDKCIYKRTRKCIEGSMNLGCVEGVGGIKDTETKEVPMPPCKG